MEKWGSPQGLYIRRLVLSTTNDLMVIFVSWGVSAASTLMDTKGMWGQRTPEIGNFGVPNTLTNRCFKLTIPIKYSHFPISQQPSKWSRNSQLLQNPKFHHSFYKIPTLDPIVSYCNLVQHLTVILDHFEYYTTIFP